MTPLKIFIVSSLPKRKIVRGKFTAVVLTPKKDIEVVENSNGDKMIHVGIGPRELISRRKLITLARRIIGAAKSHKVKRVGIVFSDFLFPRLKHIPNEEIATLLMENFEMANFEFVKFKSSPKREDCFVKEIVFMCDPKERMFIERGLKKGRLMGEEINKCRILANTPGGDMTPKLLAEEARSARRGTRVTCRILGKKEIAKLKMGAILGVAQGSVEEPKFIILEYKGGAKNERPIVFVGKGVTFDTGGINLKPSNNILDMHLDMSGGAAVIHTLVLASKLKIKKNITGLIPAVENMSSGSSYRPGDILKSMSGKTIEVLNTDAEGRIILADALTYARRYKPRLVVDIATLTGAALVALGQKASVICTKDEKLEKLFTRLGEESGEYVWPLPLWEEYEEDVKGNFADLANVPASGNSYGGAINGATFLYQFVKDSQEKENGEKAPKEAFPWVHIDMAPRMTASSGDHLAKGAVGAPIRLLVKLIEEY